MIRDLYDNSIVAYKTATRQTVNLVLDTHSPGYAQGEKEGRCRAPPPQRPGVPVHLASILRPDKILWYYAFHVRYIDFYNHERIQLKTGVAPLTLRHSA